VAWTILYTASAGRAIRGLDPPVRKRVRAALEQLQEDPERGKPLQLTLKGLRSWRTGDYRIVYRVVHDRIEVLVVAVGHRRDVYERLSERLKRE
jgi:mRNA interferase RelE/StbE